MKITLFALIASAAVITAGCVHTVSDTSTFATTWSQDSVAGRYERTVDQVYQASIAVVSRNGVVLTEYIPHDTTNSVRSVQGRVNDKKVWVRVTSVDPTITQVDVQARSSWGVSDVDLAHELEKEIALQLAR
jgi:Protein of unknown function (DUF3568)